MKKLADEAIANINERLSKQVDSRCATEDEVYMAAMACRIQELELIAMKNNTSDSDIPDEVFIDKVGATWMSCSITFKRMNSEQKSYIKKSTVQAQIDKALKPSLDYQLKLSAKIIELVAIDEAQINKAVRDALDETKAKLYKRADEFSDVHMGDACHVINTIKDRYKDAE